MNSDTVDLSTCEPGDLLVSRNGEVYRYIGILLHTTAYPYKVERLCDNLIATRTRSGRDLVHEYSYGDIIQMGVLNLPGIEKDTKRCLDAL